DPVQRPQQRLEVDVAAAGRDEVPAPLHLAEVEVRAENRAPPVEAAPRVLHVHVVDAVAELERELGRIEELRREMARVEVDPERVPAADRLERPPRRDEVVRDLGRVHLEAEADALRVEDVHDRPPALGELAVRAVDLAEVVRRERVEEVPDRRAGEAVHLRDAELRGRARRVLHPLRGAPPHTLRLAVAVDLRRQDGAVALVDAVADALADEMRADRPHVEAVTLEQPAPPLRVAGVGERPVDLEVVAPARELEAVEAPAAAALRELLERQVGPLAGEEGDRASHRRRSDPTVASPPWPFPASS